MWDSSLWESVDDRVRGGSSHSSLVPVSTTSNSARFCGFLDTTTLGGAGFASQRCSQAKIWRDLTEFTGLDISIAKADGKTYAINLKTGAFIKRPDGRVESSIEYKFLIETNPEVGKRTFYAPFVDFKPYFRGRPVQDEKPLDLADITSISIMCQSFFDAQSGEFELDLLEISSVI